MICSRPATRRYTTLGFKFLHVFFGFSVFPLGGVVHPPPTPPQTTWSTTWCVWRLCTFPLPSVAVLYKYGRLLGLWVPDMRPYGGLVHIQVVYVVGHWSECLQNCLAAHGAFCNSAAHVSTALLISQQYCSFLNSSAHISTVLLVSQQYCSFSTVWQYNHHHTRLAFAAA